MSNFFRDLRFAVRAFRAAPGFTALAVAILAMGVATVTSLAASAAPAWRALKTDPLDAMREQ